MQHILCQSVDIQFRAQSVHFVKIGQIVRIIFVHYSPNIGTKKALTYVKRVIYVKAAMLIIYSFLYQIKLI